MRPGSLDEIHRSVEEAVERLSCVHGPRLSCRIGCCQCCVDELTVFEVEALHIRQSFPELLETGEPHAEGACAFLGSGGDCRIYEARPYVCRTQGLPLRWIQEVSEEEIVEMRDICPLNEPGLPVEELSEDLCWSIGPVEERLARLQASMDRGRLRRVHLRSLFRSAAGAETAESGSGS